MEKKKRIKFLATAFTLTGTAVGAGILGIPYVFSRSGFFVGLFWLILLGIVVTYVNLYLGEISLRTKGEHQLLGYSEKYLGKKGSRVMLVAILIWIYSALLAYLMGEGQSLSKLFTGGFEYSLVFGACFWAIMSFLLTGGLRRLKRVEYFGVIVIIFIILILSLILVPSVEISNIGYFNPINLFLPFGAILFAFSSSTSVPELRNEIRGDENLLKKAILIGMIVPFILYALFGFVFVGVLGMQIEEVATLSFGGLFGKLLMILGIFTMLTSYFVLSFSLRDVFLYDLKKGRSVFFFVSFLPFILYVLVSFFELASFVELMGIGGVVSGGFVGILILLMNIFSKRKGDRIPEYSIHINWFIVLVFFIIFITGIIFEIIRLIR